ncbi:MAG: glutaconate CoA-transferase [Deltaproteobacteria bacterium]|jgi:glutaconate CoA-transferase subunit A|nr:glutaconate CoA-transferase [Deltaproteobacteria bacterium]
MHNSADKLMRVEEAVSSFVRDGDCVAFGGFVTNRRPYALVREIIRQKKRMLYIEGGPAGGDVDMLIGAGCVAAISNSYIANSGYTAVSRRFREGVEQGTLLFEDYSLDVHTIAYHGAALGLPFVPVKLMLGSDLVNRWGISREERKKHPKLPAEKFVILDDPFNPGSKVCCVPTPTIDVACIHVQMASPDGTCRLIGAPFQDVDIAQAARHTLVSCEELVSNEEIRRHPERNTLPGLCVEAVVHAPYGAHPSQCFGHYDYDPAYYVEYDVASRSREAFNAYIEKWVDGCPTNEAYIDKLGASRLAALRVRPGIGYAPGLKREKGA